MSPDHGCRVAHMRFVDVGDFDVTPLWARNASLAGSPDAKATSPS